MGAIEARASIQQFEADLKAELKVVAEEKVHGFIVLLAGQVFAQLVGGSRYEFGGVVEIGTPVDTGRAKNNWQIGIGSVPSSLLDGVSPDGKAAIERAQATLLAEELRKNPFQMVWITNNVPYIERLEDGWSKQAPNGWIRTIIERARLVLQSRGAA